MRQKVIVDGKVIGHTIRNRNTGLYDAEIGDNYYPLCYMNRGAATRWVKRHVAQPATV